MLTNNTNIPLPFAVFLAYDDYDYNDDPYTISATTLIKCVRQNILKGRAAQQGVTVDTDITGNAASSFGTAVHAAMEKPWRNGGFKQAMRAMGHPEAIINAIKINPDPKTLLTGDIPLYFEQRTAKKLGKWTITGMYDTVFQNTVMDLKTTKVYSYVRQTKTDDYIQQGSIYRWLNPEIITEDKVIIQYYFTDWKALEAKKPRYPAQNILTQSFPLMSLPATERWIINKLNELEQFWDSPEKLLPECTPKDLWQNGPAIKYYKNPAKIVRSTKNFEDHDDPALNLIDANKRLAEDGYVGVIKQVYTKGKFCRLCSARPICSQAARLEAEDKIEL